MSERATKWLYDWIAENISPEAYDPPASYIAATAEKLRADAKVAGIPWDEFEEDHGDAADIVADAFEAATDDEVSRLAGKD
ncbi:MAG: hypothetical protein ACREEO_01085 [Phenylobacterium sp.]